MPSKLNLYNCDCLPELEKMEDNQFDLAIVDPPYGINQGGDKNKTRGKLAISKDYHNFDDSKKPDKEYFAQLLRISKNQIIWGGNYFIEELKNTSCFLVWDKDNGKTDFADCELAWTSFHTAVRKFKFRWSGMLQADMVNKENRIHPTQKPVQLYKWLLSKYAKDNDSILDTHIGSGSIAIACFDLGFDLTGYEKDLVFFESMQKRIKNHTDQLSLI